MPIGVRRRGWVQVVECSGDDPIRQQIESLLDLGDGRIIVDLTRMRDLDSLILGQLVACREHARKHDAVIKLVLTPSQREFVAAARLDCLFEMFPDEEEALDSFVPCYATDGIP